MNFQIITTTAALNQVCEQAQQSDIVMLDTEFVRTRTFYPNLGLIQLYDGQTLSLIDPLEIQDMSAFQALLINQSVMKVLHACGEDLEVFQNSFGCLPTPMRDTQLMAAFLGHGLSTGFAALVNEYLEVELDKSESRTDWCARPLSPKQLDYAAADVYYLWPLYQKLEILVTDANWLEAVDQESKLLQTKRIKDINIDKLYRQMKGVSQLDNVGLCVAKDVVAWRYQEAVKRNLALNFVLKEAEMLEVCIHLPQNLQQLKSLEVNPHVVRRHGDTLIRLVKQGVDTASRETLDPVTRLVDMPEYKQVFKKLKDKVTSVSKETGLAPEFLASKKQINQLISWVWKRHKEGSLPDVMQDWRYGLFGAELLAKLEA